MRVHHLATGGTGDSHWAAERDTAVPNRTSIYPDYLRRVRCPGVDFESHTLYLKDSRDIDRGDAKNAVDKAFELQGDVLMTSGTYLMPDLGKRITEHRLATSLRETRKKVALTGALVPLKGYQFSDAGFNFGMSLSFLSPQSNIRESVLLVMNGNVFDASSVWKDLSTATYESGDGKELSTYATMDMINFGGSIDFEPDGLDGYRASENSSVPDFLRDVVRYQKDFTSQTPYPLRDSREFGTDEIEHLSELIRLSSAPVVLITTGLFRMQEFQRMMNKMLPKEHKREQKILFTGSRFSLGTPESDAPFQLGYALGAANHLKSGVHSLVGGELIPKKENLIKRVYTPEEIQVLAQQGVKVD